MGESDGKGFEEEKVKSKIKAKEGSQVVPEVQS